MRIFLTLLIVLLPLALVIVAGAVVGFALDPLDYPSDAAYQVALDDATDAVTGVSYLVFLVGYAAMASKVSYRWFDTFFQLIPIYGIIWQFRIAHRIAYLPNRDWQPRTGELPSTTGPYPYDWK